MRTSTIVSPPASHQRVDESHIETTDATWKPLFRVGAVAALIIVAFIPIQSIIFVIWPPPSTVIGWFTLFQNNKLLGLLDMDLLLIVDQVLTGLILLALYIALRRASPSFMAIALTLGLGGIAAYFASSTAFNMLSLSNQYAAATTDAQKSLFLAAGQATLTIWQGTAFDVSYILGGVAMLIISAVMLRSTTFSKGTAYVGILMSVLMFVPPTVGTIGLVFSLGSLVPLEIWLILIARRLFQLGQGISKEEGNRTAVAQLVFVAGLVFAMLTLLGDALAGGAALDTAGDQAEPVVVRALWEGSIPAFGYIGLIIMALFILLLSMEQGYFETLRQGVTLFEMLVAFFLHNKHLE